MELEVYRDNTGVLRTEYGWYGISRFVQNAATLQFELDASRQVAPSGLDRKIIERAAAILSSEAVWNRADNRVCPPSATTWSIYCATEKATIDVTGAFNHRRPAMELVRLAIEARTKGRNYHHRLMDYNNDPTTTLSDVQSLFTEVLSKTTWVQ